MRIRLFGITITVERGEPEADRLRYGLSNAKDSTMAAWERYESSKVELFEALKGMPEYSDAYIGAYYTDKGWVAVITGAIKRLRAQSEPPTLYTGHQPGCESLTPAPEA